jgi:NADH-quinone oxidoreductase subunit N
VAVLFSVSGTLDIYSIPSSVGAQPAAYRSSLLIMVLLFLSLSFYLGMFPMHLWMPDVMQGVPLPTAAFLSLGLPAVGFSVLLRLLLVVFSAKGTEGHVAWPFYGEGGWSEVLALASGTTMLAGALVAMRQASAKRMMAGLVASHLGLLLMGALVLNADGISAVVFNLTAQLFALVGVFCSLSFLYDRLGTDRLEHFRGVLYRAIPECVCLILFLACFVGFPPFPGFLGRFLLIGAAVHEHWYVLAIVATISTVVSIAAFLRLATSLAGPIPDGRVRGFAAASGTAAATATGQRAFLTLLLLPLIFLTLFAHSALQWVHQALQFQLW